MRGAKQTMFSELSVVAKALGNATRLEMLDLLAQGSRSVDELAAATSIGVSTCSANLHVLREAGLVSTVRDGKRVINFLTDHDVARLMLDLRAVALRHRPAAERAARAFLGPDDTEAMTRADLLQRAASRDIVVVDVRPEAEYGAGHLPGALSIPLDQLEARLEELPTDVEIVAYCRGALCVLSHDAVRLLNHHGYTASRTEDGILEWLDDGLLDAQEAR